MHCRFRRLILAAVFMSSAGPLVAMQNISLRDHVREHGGASLFVISCGPPIGLKEIVQYTQLTIEGTVTRAESALTAEEDSVYTDYVVEVIRVFRLPSRGTTRSTPGPTNSSPFVADDPPTRPVAATTQRVLLRSPYNGRVILDGGVVTATSGFPLLKVGQHVIVSAYFNATMKAWVPFGAFEVRDGRVVRLEERLQTNDYESVEAFAAALANPPPTVAR